MFPAQRFLSVFGAYVSVALFSVISVLGLPVTRAADRPKTIAELEEDLKKAQKERDDIRQQIEKVLAEERGLAPDPKTRKSQLAARTLKRDAARRKQQSTLKFIEEQRTAAMSAELGNNPSEEQIRKWEQTKGRPFAERRARVTAAYREKVTQIREEFQLHLSEDQRKLHERRRDLEERLSKALTKVQQIGTRLNVWRGGLRVRSQTDLFWVKPGGTATLTFFVEGGEPPYRVDNDHNSGYAWFYPSKDRGNREPFDVKLLAITRNRVELQAKAPDEPGFFDGLITLLDNSSSAPLYHRTKRGHEYYCGIVGKPESNSFQLNFPQLYFSDRDAWMWGESGTTHMFTVRFFILGGTFPYRLQATVDDPSAVDVSYARDPQRGCGSARFRIDEAGVYLVEFRATDARGAEQEAMLMFEISEKGVSEPSEKPPGNKPEKPPTPPSKPPTNPPPPAPPTAPSQGKPAMLTGRFRARLWNASFSTPARVTKENQYTPLVLSIDSGGAISSEVNYDVPENLLHKGWDNHRVAQSQNIRFTVEGTTDPKTGKSTIRILRGHREMDTQQRDGRRYQYIVEFETTLHGWRIPSPHDDDLLSNPNLDAIRRNIPAQDQRVIPNMGTDPEGKPVLLQRGFFNFVGVDPQVDPGFLQVKSNIEYWQNDDGAGSREFPAEKTPVHAWFIEILGRADGDDSTDRELLMLAIWPRSPVHVTGNTVRLTANAVYSDNVFKAVDVTDKATWIPNKATSVLEPVRNASGQIEKGHYRLRKSAFGEQGRPRSQYVRAGIRKGIDWTADTVQVVPPALSQGPVSEKSESPE